MASPSHHQNFTFIEPSIWKAIAGNSINIPPVGSTVYYFPQGHVEQSSSPPQLSPRARSRAFHTCRVLAVHLLASRDTDEVVAKIYLRPTTQQAEPYHPLHVPADGEDKVESYVKILTPSDASNGGAFAVPRVCADTVLPPLSILPERQAEYSAARTLTLTDVHGVTFDVRHIYRSSPRRNLFTSGWSAFVTQKHLVAGDAVVFMRRKGENYIGIRRGVSGGNSRWTSVTAENVVEAAERAVRGLEFVVDYYPRPNSVDFVVERMKVEQSSMKYIGVGSRVRVQMLVESEDSCRRDAWLQGTVTFAAIPNGLRRDWPWRMLKVKWDDLLDVPPSLRWISPWQVEFVEPVPSCQLSEFRLTKRTRVAPPAQVSLPYGGTQAAPKLGLTETMITQLNRFMNTKCFRGCTEEDGPDECSECKELRIGNTSQDNKTVPAEQNAAGSQLAAGLPVVSGHNNCCVRLFGSDLSSKRNASFQLFGNVIQTK